MDQKVVDRILDIQEAVQCDVTLMKEYQEYHAQFLAMLDELEPAHQNTLMNYLGVCIEIYMRMMEAAIK